MPKRSRSPSSSSSSSSESPRRSAAAAAIAKRLAEGANGKSAKNGVQEQKRRQEESSPSSEREGRRQKGKVEKKKEVAKEAVKAKEREKAKEKEKAKEREKAKEEREREKAKEEKRKEQKRKEERKKEEKRKEEKEEKRKEDKEEKRKEERRKAEKVEKKKDEKDDRRREEKDDRKKKKEVEEKRKVDKEEKRKEDKRKRSDPMESVPLKVREPEPRPQSEEDEEEEGPSDAAPSADEAPVAKRAFQAREAPAANGAPPAEEASPDDEASPEEEEPQAKEAEGGTSVLEVESLRDMLRDKEEHLRSLQERNASGTEEVEKEIGILTAWLREKEALAVERDKQRLKEMAAAAAKKAQEIEKGKQDASKDAVTEAPPPAPEAPEVLEVPQLGPRRTPPCPLPMWCVIPNYDDIVTHVELRRCMVNAAAPKRILLGRRAWILLGRRLQPPVPGVEDPDIGLASPRASKAHAVLMRNWQGKCFLMDLGSPNGTFLGNKKCPAKMACEWPVGVQAYFADNAKEVFELHPTAPR